MWPSKLSKKGQTNTVKSTQDPFCTTLFVFNQHESKKRIVNIILECDDICPKTLILCHFSTQIARAEISELQILTDIMN